MTGGLAEGAAQVLAPSETAGVGARRDLVRCSFWCWKPRARHCAGGSGEGAAAGAGFSGGGRGQGRLAGVGSLEVWGKGGKAGQSVFQNCLAVWA